MTHRISPRKAIKRWSSSLPKQAAISTTKQDFFTSLKTQAVGIQLDLTARFHSLFNANEQVSKSNSTKLSVVSPLAQPLQTLLFTFKSVNL